MLCWNQRPLFILLILCCLSGCSLFHRSVVGVASGLFQEASVEFETEKDYRIMREAIAANLKIMDGLLYIDPKNENLLESLTKGYAAYSFGVRETEALRDLMTKKRDSTQLRKAIESYSKAVEYGLRWFSIQGITYKDLVKYSRDEAIANYLDKKLGHSDSDLDTVFFTAQSMGGLINLQKQVPELIGSLGVVKGLFDWVCQNRPDYRFGSCDIFYASYEAGRPKMLGGNPQKGKDIFVKAMEKYPQNKLIALSYIQYYLIPMQDSKGYKEVRDELIMAKKKWDKSLSWSPTRELIGQSPQTKEPKMNLFNAIAFKRIEILTSLENEFL